MIQNRLMNTTQSASVYQQLLSSEMARWIPALMILLHHYDGIDRAMEPDEQPLNYLAEKLKQMNTIPIADREQLFFDVVATMPLLYYRAAGSGISWKPGNETFHQFECRVSTVSIWQEWTPHLSRNEVKNWLYANLPVSSNARATA